MITIFWYKCLFYFRTHFFSHCIFYYIKMKYTFFYCFFFICFFFSDIFLEPSRVFLLAQSHRQNETNWFSWEAAIPILRVYLSFHRKKKIWNHAHSVKSLLLFYYSQVPQMFFFLLFTHQIVVLLFIYYFFIFFFIFSFVLIK